ncbi:MAG: DUF72 domain-containing protein [Candidatus Kariarchaeaceae archaeon]|jgi:uncharacterized protein YecE (DUF72 family)
MLYIGTTGWEFEFWNGSFYPPEVDDKLEFFSSISPLVELPSTFFKIPSEEQVKDWYSKTPDSFIFTSKILRKITHSPNLLIDEEAISEYFTHLSGLKNKLGLVLLQFPTKFQRNSDSMNFMMELLDCCQKYHNGQLLVEARNRSWHKEAVKAEISPKSACFVSTDKRPISSEARDENVYYLRLMGDKNLVPTKEFGRINLDRGGDIKYWAKYLKSLNKRHQQVYVVFDNHFSGNSTNDANALSLELKQLKVPHQGFKQRK